MTDRQIYTFGYEGRGIEELVGTLQTHGVKTLLDVRLRPASRKPGWSKTKLSATCEEAGIAYLHEKDLGTPREMLDRVRNGSGYSGDVMEDYRRHLLSAGLDALDRATNLAASSPTCLLCYEADASDCHRTVVATEIAQRSSLIVKHI